MTRGVSVIMKKCKIILASLVILLIFLIGFIYNSFNGNPISKYIATKQMENYLTMNYPEEEFKIERVYYNFKLGNYVGKVYSPRNGDIQFTVSPRRNGYIYDEYIDKYAKDYELSRQFSEQIGKMVFPIVKEKVGETSEVSAEIYIKKGKYPSDAIYSKDMEESFSLNIYFKGAKVSEEEFVEKCMTVRDTILANGFKVDRFRFDYRWGIKHEGYSLDVEKEELHSSKKQLLSSKSLFNYGEINADKSKSKWSTVPLFHHR
ncbi:MAG: DUF3139 domain-containing protein [Bacillota bacterium]|nr:DUF3139 domain-containing protein [Bacillota bacterium]